MIEWLFNPWVIIIVVLAVVFGNIAALKYTAHMKFDQQQNPAKKRKYELDRLNELDKKKYDETKKK
ncbi:hypothetical protein BCU70_17180 [Vibrio sp. 10N.286.49.C2]|uniref:DUF2897 family protein n=1 Tax=unclassified Vibrio TaxID=2614977 RepID=UPI000C83EB04|nr:MULTISPECIES: DUF2897 family protein [unclassified Vibrio]PMH36806.1 hypothetical protein BCU70_17180 [Vibrio sp. 10N.286.49.C2]PMH46969.1 hypothetical protein BCU66_22285 [Vibrio sp. 10N.286.49.B1]PMH82633.1 hypothetical protein BCU58_17570 [Vibrio sp. 10N.286.48.B7]